ncbi:MAG: PQQ-binding-like beta-propeller repeat protein [Thaumarchaeota archaeon]|nr:PQQ-binding-like beta-propeller repeat protein [Nitrososphaerota archaeon]
MGLDGSTGEIKWWVQTWPHDPIDVDCNLNTLFGKIGDKKVVMKTCKSGISLGMDAGTGKPLWIYDPFSLPDGLVKRPENFDCSAPPNPFDLGLFTCLNQFCDSTVGSYEARKAKCVNAGHHNRYMMESDMAFDGKTFYSSVMSGPNYIGKITNLLGNPSGGIGAGGGITFPVNWDRVESLGDAFKRNSTITAIDALTGQVRWTWFRDEGHRGGIIVSGGVVYTNDHRGWFTMVDAETGKELGRKNIGSALTSQVTIAADADQKMKVFAIFGGAQHSVHGTRGVGGSPMVPGAILAYGLTDKLPEPQVITKEVIKEVQVPKEVIKEVPKEITKTVTVETISPVSYAAVGLGIVIAIVGIVMANRARRTTA